MRLRGISRGDVIASMIAGQPARRFVETTEVAGLITFLTQRVPAFVAGAVGWRRGGLEDDVVGNQGRDGIKVMGVEGSGEAVHEIKDGIISVPAAILPAARLPAGPMH